MSTVVYQELKTCYESNNFTESRRLSLKLISAPKDNFSKSVGAGLPKPLANSFEDVSSKPDNEAYIKCSYSNMFGWSGIEGVSNAQRETVEKEQPVYVHPLVKRSSCMLSQKSLEMCTESLGCETGTCILDSSVFNQSALASNEVRKPRPKVEARKEIIQAKLPPPLTSISGPNSIHVKPIREHGRLVIKAVSTPATHSCLQAERSNGRLRLSLVQECSSDAELDSCSSDDEDNDDMYDCEIPVNNERECCTQNDSNDKNNNDDEDPHQRSTQAVSIAKVEVKEKEEEVGLGENMKDVKLMLEVKVGEYVKIQRPSRCKERGQGNKRLVNWEPFWVAT